MKISVILPFTFMTGGIKVLSDYGNYLQDQGHDVTFYLPFIPYRGDSKLSVYLKSFAGNILLDRYKIKGYSYRFRLKLVPKISSCFLENADLLIADAWFTAYDVMRMPSEKGKKVYFIQDFELMFGSAEKVLETYRMPLHQITITKTLQQQLRPYNTQEAYVVYNGTKEDEFCDEYYKSPNKHILMMYSFGKHKCSEDGLQILKNIQEKTGQQIVIFGKGRCPDLPDGFEFYENPEREKLMELYREASIYLFTSREEAWGLPVMEAMANKCAVVGTNIGCVKELGIHEENMMVSDPNDFGSMEEDILKLLSDNELLEKVQENGYKISRKYTWENSCEQMEKYLIKVVREYEKK